PEISMLFPHRFKTARREHSAGYTLIEIAVVMTIAGILVAAFLGAYTVYNKHRAAALTAERAQIIVEAIREYQQTNGFYPCPAPMEVARGAGGYGHAGDCSIPGAVNTCSD